MLSSLPLSEAARRVLERAETLAVAADAQTVGESHLLLAIWQDESRGCELLEQAGITAEVFTEQFPDASATISPTRRPSGLDTSLDTSSGPPRQPLDHEAGLNRALSAAQSHAGQLGKHTELGTDHLLLGLLDASGTVADWLTSCGLTLEDLLSQVADQSGFSDAPIPVECRLAPTVISQPDRSRVDRILDAAANRCREGLRVVEDFTRFILDDAHLSRILKELRHDFAAALVILPAENLLRSRDTPGDVGTRIDTSAERQRLGPQHVARANAKRVEESLRTLEEFGKIVNSEFAARCEQLRYRFYTVEQAIEMTFLSRERLADCRLYLLVTDRACPQGAGPMIRAALAGGVDAVQLREKEMPDRRLIDLAHRVREWTHDAGALFIMNDRPDIAALVHADGVHVGQDDMSVRETRQIIGSDCLIGVSTHTIEQARQAVFDGADYLGVGPTFPSLTKQFNSFAGLDFIREAAAEIVLPWFAIGGVNTTNLSEVLAAGASRIAVSGAITGDADPETAARHLGGLFRDRVTA